MENRFHHLPAKALISLKQKVKAHNLSCLDQAAASRLVSWPSVPLTHTHPFISWTRACHSHAQGLLMVPHHTGQDDVAKSNLRSSHNPNLLDTHSNTPGHRTSVLVHALLFSWKDTSSPSSKFNAKHHCHLTKMRKRLKKVKGEPLHV